MGIKRTKKGRNTGTVSNAAARQKKKKWPSFQKLTTVQENFCIANGENLVDGKKYRYYSELNLSMHVLL